MSDSTSGGRSGTTQTTDPSDYFAIAIVKYACGDIRALLDAKLKVAGPLLNTVVDAIDVAGGMLFGFTDDGTVNGKLNSANRSTSFMTMEMGIPGDVAKMIYENVRCGSGHQGMPKYGIEFDVDYTREDKEMLWLQPKGEIFLSVVAFAKQFLASIEAIQKDMKKVVHAPHLIEKTKNLHATAVAALKAKATGGYGASKGASSLSAVSVAVPVTPATSGAFHRVVRPEDSASS